MILNCTAIILRRQQYLLSLQAEKDAKEQLKIQKETNKTENYSKSNKM